MASYLVLLLIGDYETEDGGRSSTGVELDSAAETAGRRRRRQLRRPRRPPAVVLHRPVRHRTRSIGTASRSPTRPQGWRWRRRGCRSSAGTTSTAPRATSSSCCCRTRWRISGSATPSRRRSGTTSGSTKDGRPTPNGCGSTTKGSTRSTGWRSARCRRRPTAAARSAGPTTCSATSPTTAAEPHCTRCG